MLNNEHYNRSTERNLCVSPYTIEYGGYTFYFSTQKRCEKFIRNLQQHAGDTAARIHRAIGGVHLSNYTLNILTAISLYNRIEDNGFYVRYEDTVFTDLCEFELSIGWCGDDI